MIKPDVIKAKAWPPEDLEHQKSCPACESPDRALLYRNLWDATFLVAPGRWSLWGCRGCGTAYLDPRPNVASIGRAYEDYYTHHGLVDAPPKPQGLFSLVRGTLADGYRAWRFGTGRGGWAALLGVPAAFCFPVLRRAIDQSLRYLPKVRSAERRVLDVGCGSGAWLFTARDAGWSAHGVDFDPKAVEYARSRGLDIREGGIETWADSPGSFDALTMSHFIEHVHHPREVLAAAFRLLKPGGQLHIETPSIEAPSRKFFGPDWRGLEPPRHLAIFSPKGLRHLLTVIGFTVICEKKAASPIDFLISESEMIAARTGTPRSSNHDRDVRKLRTEAPNSSAEFIVLTCRRPGEA